MLNDVVVNVGAITRFITNIIIIIRISISIIILSSYNIINGNCLELHIEWQRPNIGHWAHTSHASHHFAFNVFETFALRFWHIHDNEYQSCRHDTTKYPECTAQTAKPCKTKKAQIISWLPFRPISSHIYIPIMSWNVFVTMNVHDQLNAVATDAAEPRILAGKISPIINHGIGPKPIENDSTKIIKLANGNQEISSTLLPCPLAKKYAPNATNVQIMPTDEMYKRIWLAHENDKILSFLNFWI